MASFGERVQVEMEKSGLRPSDLCRRSGLKSGHVSPYLNGKTDRDPRLSTAVAIADALDVSLDYLAGRTDNPSGFTPEELEGLRIDAETRALLRDYDRLTPDGRETIREQVDFQLSKNRAQGPDSSVCEVA